MQQQVVSQLVGHIKRCSKQLLIMSGRRRQHKFAHSASTRTPLRVLVDMDGVLCDFEQHFLDLYQAKYPDLPCVPLEQRRTFYLSDDYERVLGESFNRDITNSIYESEGFFRDLQPIEGGVDAVKEISGMDNVEVYICTSPVITSKYCVQEKLGWIETHFGHDWLNRMVIAKDKTVVKGHILIDDKPKIRGSEKPPMWDHVLFTCWHNKHLDIAHLKAKHRLDSWTSGQLKNIVEMYQKQIL